MWLSHVVERGVFYLFVNFPALETEITLPYLYCYTVQFEDSLNITHKQMH